MNDNLAFRVAIAKALRVVPEYPRAFREGECAPTPGCSCMCHDPASGMAVSHFAPCCER